MPGQVTVNSGGVVFFAFFNRNENDEHHCSSEAAAVIKFSSSRMATQSELLGYEFAKWLGVQTPQVVSPCFDSCLLTHEIELNFEILSTAFQARIIHNVSPEWLQIKEAAEKAKDTDIIQGNELAEMTCSELLEALELSRCFLLMKCVLKIFIIASNCVSRIVLA